MQDFRDADDSGRQGRSGHAQLPLSMLLKTAIQHLVHQDKANPWMRFYALMLVQAESRLCDR